MGFAQQRESWRALGTAIRLCFRARAALRRGIPRAAEGYLLEAFLYMDDALGLIRATGTPTEYAKWVAAVDRAVDAYKKPWSLPEAAR